MNHVACCFQMGGLTCLLSSSLPPPPLLVSLLIKWAKTCACDGVRLRGRNTSSLTCRSPSLADRPTHVASAVSGPDRISTTRIIPRVPLSIRMNMKSFPLL